VLSMVDARRLVFLDESFCTTCMTVSPAGHPWATACRGSATRRLVEVDYPDTHRRHLPEPSAPLDPGGAVTTRRSPLAKLAELISVLAPSAPWDASTLGMHLLLWA
jgi:hypothetical protein